MRFIIAPEDDFPFTFLTPPPHWLRPGPRLHPVDDGSLGLAPPGVSRLFAHLALVFGRGGGVAADCLWE